jgi:outer membrane receptor protein involved in Fe transport
MKHQSPGRNRTALAAVFIFAAAALFAQQAPTPPPASTATTPPGSAVRPRANVVTDETTGETIVTLTPFEVSTERATGYTAATTLAGNRLNTELRDIGNAVSVITAQFLRDTGAVSNTSLLQYTAGTEVGTVEGNFAGVGDGALLTETSRFTNSNQNTRVRGLAAADNTRDYFITDIPWDGYNVDRVDLSRGPNSILFGLGSPAGIINTSTRQAGFKNSAEAEFRFGSYESHRSTIDINRVLIKDQLAVRVSALRDDEKFRQDPAYDLDRRLFGALRFEPAFLKRAGARTIVKANIEAGRVSSNRPRTLPPIDLITPWFDTGTYQGLYADGRPRTFNNLNRAVFTPFQVQEETGRPNTGQSRPTVGGVINPYYQPLLGNFAQSFGGPVAYFNGQPNTPAYYHAEMRVVRGIGPNGNIDGNIGGIPFHRQGGIAPYANFARNANLPFSGFGVYKHRSLTDASVFDYYENLLDGPNKNEWQNFTTYSGSIAQTFLNDRVGVELVQFQERYRNGQLSFLTDGRQSINIDLNSVYIDGTPAGRNGLPFADGTPNPNLGRPFISDSGQFGNNSLKSERDSSRATLFATHNFAEGRRHWLLQAIGRHTLTGMFAHDERERDQRSFQRWAVLDPAYRTFLGAPSSIRFTDNLLAPNPVIYLGPSLLNRTSASGLNIPRPDRAAIPVAGAIRTFDSTWVGRGVNPSDPWTNPAGFPPSESTQAENPANYVGWRNLELNITDSERSPNGRDLLTTSARLSKNRVSSRVLVWQGHFLENALVGTIGWRRDVAKSWAFERRADASPGFGQVDLGPTYRLPDNANNRAEGSSRSHSIVGHLNQLPLIKEWSRRLPVNVSLFYSKADNFQPEAQRVDIYGDPITAPAGQTHDRGILLETKNGKFSLKVNKYKTTVINATSSGLGGSWFIGTSQAWAGNWANIFEHNLGGDTIQTQGQGDPGRYTYGAGPGETVDQAAAREAAAISAWRNWQRSVDPRFYRVWGLDIGNLNRSLAASAPPGFSITEDAISEGYEFELNAQPTRNWRLTFNATKTEAQRTNIGGTTLSQFFAAYENVLKTTPAGDLRIWWGNAGAETALFQWNSNVGSEYAGRKLQEGTNVPELRKWRYNLITNYDFTEGRLRGFNVGGGLRWQDEVVIGYRPVPGRTAADISFDLSKPYMGPAETNVDLWIGYTRRKVFQNVDWRVQLNIRNALAGDDLIPITAQPDGTPAGYRIAPYQTWTLSNSFKF